MCEACDPKELAKTYAGVQIALLKRLDPDLAKLVAAEVALRDRVWDLHVKASHAAVTAAISHVSGSKAIPAMLSATEAAYKGVFDAPAIKAMNEGVDLFYRLGSSVMYRKATGQLKGTLAIPLIDPPLAKAAANLVTSVGFDVVDTAAVDALKKQQVFWIGGHFEANISGRIAAVAQDVLIEQGLDGAAAGDALRTGLTTEFGLAANGVGSDLVVPIPEGWHGPLDQYFRGVATNAATVARSYGSVNALHRVGVKRLVVSNPLDARSCERCKRMDGKVFLVQDAKQQMDKVLAAKTPDGVRAAQPWLPESWFGENVPMGSGMGSAAGKGVLLPTYHSCCRCVVDIDDSDVVAAAAENAAADAETVAENAVVQEVGSEIVPTP